MSFRRIFALLAGCMPLLASAQGFDYSFVEGRIVSSELNTGPLDVDGDGIGIAGSVAILPRYHIFASYDDQGYDFSLDATTTEIGAGYNLTLHEDFDFVGRLSYIERDISRPGPDITRDGFGIEGGVRGRFTPRVEFDTGIRYTDLGRSDTSLFFAGRYLLRPTLGVGGGLTSNDGDMSLTATIRFVFGAAR